MTATKSGESDLENAERAEVTLYINLVRRALYDEMAAYNCLKGTLLFTADTWRTWEAIDSSPLSLFLCMNGLRCLDRPERRPVDTGIT